MDSSWGAIPKPRRVASELGFQKIHSSSNSFCLSILSLFSILEIRASSFPAVLIADSMHSIDFLIKITNSRIFIYITSMDTIFNIVR